MNGEEFAKAVADAVREYISEEESYDDNAQLAVDPSTLEISLHDGEEDLDDFLDQYCLMDLVEMDSDGSWKPDGAAIADLASEYFE